MQGCLLIMQAAIFPIEAGELDVYLGEDTIEFSEEYDKRLRYAPKTVVVYDQNRISLTGTLNIGELLERVTGVHITRKFYGASADKFVRGNGANWIILHNGVEIERTLPELFAIPIADIERLEVLKGSHFAVYGPAAIIGTINIVTFGASENKTTISARFGSLNTNEVWARQSKKKDNIGYSAFIYHSETDGNNATIERDRQTNIDEQLGTSSSFAPSSGNFEREVTDFRLTLELGDEWSVHQYASLRSSGVGVGLVQALDPNGTESLSRSSTNVHYNKKYSDASVDVKLGYNIVQADFSDLYMFPPGTLGGLFPDGVIQSYGQTGREITFGAVLGFERKRHGIEVGFGAKQGKVENDFDKRNYIIQNNSPVPVPTGSINNYDDDNAIFDKKLVDTMSYLLLRDQIRLTNDVKFDLGLRIDRASRYGTVVNPRMGLEWTASEGTDIYLLYGESSEIPTIIQASSNGYFGPLGNKDLKPTKIRMLEVAAKHQFSRNSEMMINTYIHKQSDTIGAVDYDESPIGTRFENIKEDIKGIGLELDFNHKISPQFEIIGGIAIHKNTGDETSDSIAPKYLPSFEASYYTQSGWKSNVSVFAVSGRYRELGDVREEIDDYVITSISVSSKTLFKNTTFSVDMQNIFDVDAREDISDQIEYDLPVWPRRLLVGFKATFQ